MLLESLRDPLTGLFDWHGLSYCLEHGDVSAPGKKGTRTLIYVDLVGLDRVNAEHGQPFGDSVLQRVAQLLASRMPEGCTVGRVGGDEFLIIMHSCEEDEARRLADGIAQEIDDFSPEGGARGKIEALKVQLNVIPSVPKDATLAQVVAGTRVEAALGGGIEFGEKRQLGCYALPHVTLGTCALFLWDEPEVSVRNKFAMWRLAPGGGFLEKMAKSLTELIALRAEGRPFDFVTAPPAGNEREPAQHLARKVAELLGVPHRQVLVPSTVSSVIGYSEPRVDAPLTKASHVLLVVDLIEPAMNLRSCVRRLSEAGAFVQVVGWAVKRLDAAAGAVG